MFKTIIVMILALMVFSLPVQADDGREVFVVEIDASIDDIWSAFTTTEGLKLWVAPMADIDLRVGGLWRANYQEGGSLGDSSTIENTILSFDIKRMLSLKATGFPADFEFKEAAKSTWSVFYFESISANKTKITVVGLGYNDTEQSKKMRSFFDVANKYSMDQLQAAMIKLNDKKN